MIPKLSKQHLDKILNLNAEHATALPPRRKEIEDEIRNMIPPEMRSSSPKASELVALQNSLKEQIKKLAECSSISDFDDFFHRLDNLDAQINAHAKTLGVSIPRTDYQAMKQKLVELHKNANK